MKVLIWFGCFFVSTLLQRLLFGNARLGGLLIMIVYGVTIGVARTLCDAWDEHKGRK